MQLEQNRLCVKITAGEDENRSEIRGKAIKEILNISEEKNLYLKKPIRTRNGKNMTVAEQPDSIATNAEGLVDFPER